MYSRYFCEYCGEEITPTQENASDFFEDESMKYDSITGARLLVKTIKCKKYGFFNRKHTYRLAHIV